MRFLLLSLLCFACLLGLDSLLGHLEGPVSRLLERDVPPSEFVSLGGSDGAESPAAPTPDDESTEDDVCDDVQDELVAMLSVTTPRARRLTRIIVRVSDHIRRDSSLVGRSREGPEAPPPRV